ncbi:MAG: pyridoxamine 5'-phosphate oxidase family protein [Deltaproteobacteria bacterium]|nr:pyridoxamine 5'-phosphate oxidase family protein [Deltaproteobacteria bacterium]
MGQRFPTIQPEHRGFIQAQPMFFVATAPPQGRINLSPKGLDTLRVVDERTVVWMNLTGSGNETAAHLLADGRMTLMFCAFEGKPLILRLYGRGSVVHPGQNAWGRWAGLFPPLEGVRQAMVMTVEEVQTSCGYGVPRMDYVEQREILPKFLQGKGEEGLKQYRQQKNRVSLDGLPTGLPE